MNNIAKQFIITFIKNLVSNIKGVQFVFLTYTTKETNYRTSETSLYKLNIGANIENLYNSDIETLENLTMEQIRENSKFSKFTDDEIIEAKNEILNSLHDSLNNGIGNNSNYTKQGYYKHLNKNVKYSTDEDGNIQTLYINALCESKQVLNPAIVKRVKNSRAKTIIKNLINSGYLKRSKFREYRIDINQIKTLNISKHKLLIDASI